MFCYETNNELCTQPRTYSHMFHVVMFSYYIVYIGLKYKENQYIIIVIIK